MAAGRAPSQMVLVYGEEHASLSASLARRCGGTLVDLQTLLRSAEEDPSDAGSALQLLWLEAGFPMIVALALLEVIEEYVKRMLYSRQSGGLSLFAWS